MCVLSLHVSNITEISTSQRQRLLKQTFIVRLCDFKDTVQIVMLDPQEVDVAM